MKNYCLFILIIVLGFDLYSQNGSQWRQGSSQNFQMPNMSLKGKLLDSESNEGLSYASISLYTKDSILISGGISEESGKFRIEFQPRDVIKKIRENRTSSVVSPNTRGFNLYANISYVGFESRNIDLSYSFENTEIDLKNIYLLRSNAKN